MAFARDGATARIVSAERMRAIHEEIQTPYKYGVVLDLPAGKMVDCPNVFRHGDRWYMFYVQFEPKPAEGYSTQLAVSDDLLHWRALGPVVTQGAAGTWDQANAGAGLALQDPQWGGSNALGTFQGKYWLSYLGGDKFGFEGEPLSIGLASTDDPATGLAWTKLPHPVLRSADADARPGERGTLYKSYILRDDTRTLGAPFVMFYNAKASAHADEWIFAAVSDDLKSWRRSGDEPVIAHARPEGRTKNVISGDPQVVRMGDVWVMFYFGYGWQPGAFDTFAASYDLVHWTKWTGGPLVASSEPYDDVFAHKPWVVKHDGVVYHFYCATGGKNNHRTIALATSRDLSGKGQE
jgi:beta-xylosidase